MPVHLLPATWVFSHQQQQQPSRRPTSFCVLWMAQLAHNQAPGLALSCVSAHGERFALQTKSQALRGADSLYAKRGVRTWGCGARRCSTQSHSMLVRTASQPPIQNQPPNATKFLSDLEKIVDMCADFIIELILLTPRPTMRWQKKRNQMSTEKKISNAMRRVIECINTVKPLTAGRET